MSSGIGACCIGDGSCRLLTKETCDGTFLGEGASCEPNPCSDATGACCLGPNCIVLTRQECDARGGAYQGDGISCDPNPCEIVPTIDSSWGKIKNLFRQ